MIRRCRLIEERHREVAKGTIRNLLRPSMLASESAKRWTEIRSRRKSNADADVSNLN
jgi:hypothetical protein